MRYRDLSLIVRIVTLVTRSRVVQIVGLAALLGWSLWQQAHAGCPSNYTQKYQLTGYSCPIPFCGSQEGIFEAERGKPRSTVGFYHELLESAFPTGSSVAGTQTCKWLGVSHAHANQYHKEAQRPDTTFCATVGVNVQFGDYCEPQATSPPPEPPPTPVTPEQQQNCQNQVQSKHGRSCTGVGAQPKRICYGGCEYGMAGLSIGQGWAANANPTGNACPNQTSNVSCGDAGDGVGGVCKDVNGVLTCQRKFTPSNKVCGEKDGVEVCVGVDAEGDKGCGTVNGEKFCQHGHPQCGQPGVKCPPPTNCQGLNNGAVACGAAAPPQVKPQKPGTNNAEDPANAADPDHVANTTGSDGVSSTTVIYNPGTVAASPTNEGGEGSGGQVGGGNGGEGGGGDGEGGDGDGDGECEEGEDCGDGEQKGAPSAACDEAPTCDDVDLISCALLRQSWTNVCQTLDPSKIGTPAQNDAAGIPNGTDAQLVAQLNESVNMADVMDSIIPPRSNSACPTAPSMSVMGKTYRFDFEPICQYLELAGIFVICFSTLLAVRIAIGGS